jgi:hypothetical protein
LEDSGLLMIREDHLAATDKGRLVLNHVIRRLSGGPI